MRRPERYLVLVMSVVQTVSSQLYVADVWETYLTSLRLRYSFF